MKIVLGTRGSALALTQSGTVADALRAAGFNVDIAVIRTEGDRSQALSFGSIGAQGVFVREIEQALLRGDIDVAVHSFKDLPTESPAGLTVAAIPRRADAADVLFLRGDAAVGDSASFEKGDSEKGHSEKGHSEKGHSEKGHSEKGHSEKGHSANGASEDGGSPLPAALPRGARVGTSSVRRGAWLRHFRPDIVVEPLRGNVPTRLGRLREGRYDAILLAAAGVDRLEAGHDALEESLDGLVACRLDPRRFVPAPAQGALAVQCRDETGALRDALAALDDAATRAAVTLERDALRRAEGGCNTAFGAYGTPLGTGFELTAMLERDGRVVAARVEGAAEDLLDRVWSELRA